MDTDSLYMALTENDLYDCFTEIAKTQMQENAKCYHEQEDSKTYCAFNENNKKMKMALKGSNKNLESLLERFKSVLFKKVPYEGTNKGFRYYRGNMFTYKQNKMSITYFYYKRFVHADGVTTSNKCIK